MKEGPRYPRTCRNGHEIDGPEDEHYGGYARSKTYHRQCWKWRTQVSADAKWRESHPGYRMDYYWRVERRRDLEAQRVVVMENLTALEKEIDESLRLDPQLEKFFKGTPRLLPLH